MSKSSRNSLPSRVSEKESESDQGVGRCLGPGRERMERGLERKTERVAGRTWGQPRRIFKEGGQEKRQGRRKPRSLLFIFEDVNPLDLNVNMRPGRSVVLSVIIFVYILFPYFQAVNEREVGRIKGKITTKGRNRATKPPD